MFQNQSERLQLASVRDRTPYLRRDSVFGIYCDSRWTYDGGLAPIHL